MQVLALAYPKLTQARTVQFVPYTHVDQSVSQAIPALMLLLLRIDERVRNSFRTC
jgi:hypothetical protein